MGLLGDGWDSPQSQGIMALAGGLLSGNFGQGVSEMGKVMAGAKDRELARRMQAMQEQKAMMEMDGLKQAQTEKKAMIDLAARFQGKPGLPAVMGDAESGILPHPGKPATGFDYPGYANALSGVNPREGLAMQQLLQKDDTPVKLSPGEQLFGGKASGYKPLLSVPAKESAPPSAVQE